jgi:TDG/mug DNA glycosylase family protein
MAVLPDILEPNLQIIFCGTAVSARSAKVGAYYAGPQNQFWIVLHEVGLTPRRLEPHEFRTLPQYGIGLTDLVKSRSGMDHTLAQSDFDSDAVRSKIEQFAPRVLAFNGKRAAKEFFKVKTIEYGLQTERVGTTAVFVLPSTSAAAYQFVPGRRADSIAIWRALATFTQGT